MEVDAGEHATWRERVPEFVMGRLGSEERIRFETHLSACPECAETVDAWRVMVSAMREPEAETLWEPHPEPEAIHRHALGRSEDEPRVARHVVACPSCALEMQAWKDSHDTARVGAV